MAHHSRRRRMPIILFLAFLLLLLEPPVVAGKDQPHGSLRQLLTFNVSTADEDPEDSCPPCPLQCPEVVQCPAQAESTPSTSTAEDPLVLQILVVDSPGIITMGEC